jgi:hypothetical protein
MTHRSTKESEMRSGTMIPSLAALAMLAEIAIAQTAPPQEVRTLHARPPTAMTARPPIQVVDLRSAVTRATPAEVPPMSTTLAARHTGPTFGRSLASSELASALQNAQISLVTQNVYASLTPTRLSDENKAVTRIVGGIQQLEPQFVFFNIGAGRSMQVDVALKDSGVYVLDYSVSTFQPAGVDCTIRHNAVSQKVQLAPWQQGEEASHIVVAVNYAAGPAANWPGVPWSNAVVLWCVAEESTIGFKLYGINVTRP